MRVSGVRPEGSIARRALGSLVRKPDLTLNCRPVRYLSQLYFQRALYFRGVSLFVEADSGEDRLEARADLIEFLGRYVLYV